MNWQIIYTNKNVDIKFSACDTGITFIRYAQSQNIQKPNNSKVFGSKKAKRSKQESYNLLRSPMHERGEPYY